MFFALVMLLAFNVTIVIQLSLFIIIILRHRRMIIVEQLKQSHQSLNQNH